MGLRGLLPLAVVMCAGCASSHEGAKLASAPYVDAALVEYGRLPERPDHLHEAHNTDSGSNITGLIAIGTVTVLREYTQESFKAEYDDYSESFATWGSGLDPTLTFDEFSETMSGWTLVRFFQVPMLYGLYAKSLVPKSLAANVQFDTPFAAVMVGASGDLVAARTNADGAFVLTAVLCKRQPTSGFVSEQCAESYEPGIFDAATGKQLTSKLALKRHGRRIDLQTFRVVQQ
ncbi:MAG TPA: hypothetical protein VFV10_15585 [Gammaproteobacteria bacterium]|nr:hypothetical protein [Gammaproteobacteria bacterium]